MNLNKVVLMLTSVIAMLAPQMKSEDSVHGIKDLKEAVDGSLALGLVIAERLKDGVGFDDLAALWDKWKNDEEIQAKLKAAVDNYKAIPEQAKDVDAGEGLELAAVALGYVTKYVDALKKEDSTDSASV